MKSIFIAMILSSATLTLSAVPTKINCPNPKDLKVEEELTLHYAIADGWSGVAKVQNIPWFFNGTDKVEADSKGNALLKCHYKNRSNSLALSMTTSYKAADCAQDVCEKPVIKGKGAGKKMLESCTYSCGK